MPDTTDSSQRQVTIDPQSPGEANVPDRDVADIDRTFLKVRKGDNVSLTIGFDDTVQDVEVLTDEICRDGGELNPDWDTEFRFVAKVVPPESADDLDQEFLQIFVTGTSSGDSSSPWFVYSYRVERSTGNKMTFVDPETGDEHPVCFAHGWVVDMKNFYGGDIR